MPELPEVETIARALRLGGREGPSIVGKTIAGVDILWERSIAAPSNDEFKRQIAGQIIAGVSRRGKFLVFTLSSGTLLVHLRMSGDLRVIAQKEEALAHDRVRFHFSGGDMLAFNDPRKFGRIWLVKDPVEVLGDLGPEPFDPALEGVAFHRMLQSTRRQIKPLLLDQRFLAGVGNIYSDEALHKAGIHPLTPANQIDPKKAEALLAAVREILEEGIHRNGASIDWVYRGGDFQNHFRVYQRTGEPCPVCGTKIERQIIGQRSTHFCPHCQPGA